MLGALYRRLGRDADRCALPGIGIDVIDVDADAAIIGAGVPFCLGGHSDSDSYSGGARCRLRARRLRVCPSSISSNAALDALALVLVVLGARGMRSSGALCVTPSP